MSETEYAGHLKILISGQNPHVRTYSGSQKRTRNLHSTHSFTKERLRNRFAHLHLLSLFVELIQNAVHYSLL